MASDLISRGALIKELQEWYDRVGDETVQDRLVQNIITYAMDDVNEAEAVDAEPVRHGEWVVERVDANQTTFYCSECERCVRCGNDYFMKPTKHVAHVYPYCHCGAKMDGGKEE